MNMNVQLRRAFRERTIAYATIRMRSILVRVLPFRPTILTYAHAGSVPELLGGDLVMVIFAQRPAVSIPVLTAERQRPFVIDYRRRRDPAFSFAHAA